MAEKKIVAIGKKVRDFSLPAHDKKQIRLSTLRGKKVLLSWHPLAWTGICTQQMKSLDKHRRAFAKFGTIALGLSVDPVPAKAAWAASMKLKGTQLLSDFWPHGKVAKALGIFRKADGISERANIVLDEAGRVIFAKVYPLGKLPDIEEILAFLKSSKRR